MLRRLICLASLALVLGVAGNAQAILVGHWKLDGNAADSSISGLDGEITGSPGWVDGKVGLAMEIDGDDWIEIPGTSATDGYAGLSGEVTWAVWFKTSDSGVIGSVMTLGPAGAAHIQGNRSINVEAAGDIMIRAHSVGALTSLRSTATVADGEWHHVAVTIAFETDGDNDTLRVYIDGDLSKGYEATDVNVNLHAGPAADFIMTLGARGTTPFVGLIDDARVYDHVLTEDEILAAMAGGGGGFPLALLPNPEDGALLEATWANLSWRAGSYAVSHDLYFGTAFDDVNDAAEGTFAGNVATTAQVVGFPGFPAPDGLLPGTTYFWRVDEVNDANAASPWKGDVWSFTVPPMVAYEPDPSNGTEFVRTDITLSWTPGFGAKLHSVYFGDNLDNVSSAAGAVPQTGTSFALEALELEKTYYWRVDEFDGAATHTGDVWSFTTLPVIEMTGDPNFVGWWKLDEGMGDTVVDHSGHGHHGTIYGDPLWVDGHDGGALQFGGDRIEMPGTSASDGYAALDGEVSWTAWIKTSGAGATKTIMAQGPAGAAHVQGNRSVNVEASGVIMIRGNGVADLLNFSSTGTVNDDQWHHVAVTIAFETNATSDTMKVYIDGDLGAGFEVDSVDINQHSGVAGDFIFTVGDRAGSPFTGLIDDVRVYDKVLTLDEIVMVMRIDPLLAWQPKPANGSTPDIDNATPLSWAGGDSASSHEVYFGLDKDAVANADTSDTTGIYRGNQNGTSFTPTEGVEWGAGPFYWRIDENNADGTVTTGRVWTFTVADFILVDDFESYTDNDAAGEAIWQSWIDGFGVPTNGAQAGYLLPPYAEQTIVNGGNQSMPLVYNNTAGVRNSEAVLTLAGPRDWTKNGVAVLSLWLRGNPASVGSFTEGPVGTFTMTGSGADIWATSDQFHFAYKTLTGPATIIARVNSVQNTHAWAKAGVMIRETLDANSKHASVFVTPENGVAFQGRTDPDVASFSENEADITAPHWVRLERDAVGNFTASHSTNGSDWVPVSAAFPQNIPMDGTIFVGLALTSHDAAQTAEAVFSNVTMTGSVGAQWEHQDVGILSNAAEPLYVALSNATGAAAVVVNENPGAATIETWTEWTIDLQKFADQGVNLADVDKIAVGLGATGDAAAAGGSGTVFVDDVTLLRPISEQP